MNGKKYLYWALAVILCCLLFTAPGCLPSEEPEIINEDHIVVTADNVDIALFHYSPADEPVAAVPVLLCPGIFQNHFAFDLSAESSMAKYLAGRGIDTWSLDYRGRGLSGVPAEATETFAPWSTDDFGYLDIAAAAAFIANNSTSGELFVLGFCEGAAAVIAYLLEGDPGYVRGQVQLAPRPVVGATSEDPFAAWTFDQIIDNFFFYMEPGLPADAFVDIPGLFQLYYQFFHDFGLESLYFQLDLWEMLWHKENMTNDLAKEVILKVLSPISSNEIKQLLRGADYFNRKGVCTFEGSALEQAAGPFCYLERLPEIKVPTLVLAGNVDDFTPPVNAQFIYNSVGSQDKAYKVLGLSQGDHSDYGHYDLTVGVHAVEDVYPLIADWFLERM